LTASAQDRLEALRLAVENGTYDPSAAATADKIIEEHLQHDT
jgi:anti-sigma28 factor (negative regulator of flagellin synthesis)